MMPAFATPGVPPAGQLTRLVLVDVVPYGRIPRNPAGPDGTVTVAFTAIANSPLPGSVQVLSPPYVEPNASVSKLRAFAAPLTMTPPTLRVSIKRQGV